MNNESKDRKAMPADEFEANEPIEVEGSAKPTKKNKKQKAKKPVWREYSEALLTAAILAFIIRTFLFQAFHIPSGSMKDTLLIGDFLFVSKALYGAEIPFTGGTRLPKLRAPKRGDIVVFRYPEEPDQDFIKRCVGTPGDVLEMRNKVLFVNGEEQNEPYTRTTPGKRLMTRRGDFFEDPSNWGPITVPEDRFFMLGDNRDDSKDSRYWGYVDYSQLRGKALFIYWSWDKEFKLPRFSRIFDITR